MTDRSFSTVTECPICFDTLFNDEGVADQDVAEIMCMHPVHSECLAQAGRALNADGSRYGVGGLGNRAGCPICGQPVSCWTDSKEAGFFKGFWIERIERALQELGPATTSDDSGQQRRMPVDCSLVREKLKQDPTLSETQKRLVRKPRFIDSDCDDLDDDDSGFCKALSHAGHVDYCKDRVMFASFLMSKGIWKYEADKDKLWLWEWSRQHPTLSRCSNCGAKPNNLKMCQACIDSCEAPMYCNKECQKADWGRHKKICKQFGVMKQGGTREELLQRLRLL